MLQTKEKQIGEHRYQVTQLSAPQGRKLLVRLYKVLGPSLGALAKGLDSGKGDLQSIGDVRLSFLGDALGELAHHLNEDDLEHVCELMGKYTTVNVGGDKWMRLSDIQDLHWAGKYEEMFAWLAFALEVNYAGFFKGTATLGSLGSKLRGAAAVSESASASPSTLTGSSGVS